MTAHRGRFQAQGPAASGSSKRARTADLNESERWDQGEPLPAAAGHGLLDTLAAKLEPADLTVRSSAFEQAHHAIEQFKEVGGLEGPPYPQKLSYYPIPRDGKRRVDIDLFAGKAFV